MLFAVVLCSASYRSDLANVCDRGPMRLIDAAWGPVRATALPVAALLRPRIDYPNGRLRISCTDLRTTLQVPAACRCDAVCWKLSDALRMLAGTGLGAQRLASNGAHVQHFRIASAMDRMELWQWPRTQRCARKLRFADRAVRHSQLLFRYCRRRVLVPSVALRKDSIHITVVSKKISPTLSSAQRAKHSRWSFLAPSLAQRQRWLRVRLST
jgi:hypothetical protein